jgi:hypothetical protein
MTGQTSGHLVLKRREGKGTITATWLPIAVQTLGLDPVRRQWSILAMA